MCVSVWGLDSACPPVQEGPAFRYTTSEVTVQPSPCLSYRIPRDFVDLSTGEDAYKLIDFLKLVGPGSRVEARRAQNRVCRADTKIK